MEKEELYRILNMLTDELRGIHELNKKMTISIIILICIQDNILFSELLYGNKNVIYWQEKVEEYLNTKGNVPENGKEPYFIEKLIDNSLYDKIFDNVIQKLIKIYDKDKFFKALYEKDEFALAIVEIEEIFNGRKVVLDKMM